MHVFVLCYDGSFYERVPADVGSKARGRETAAANVEALKLEYRLALACDGYMLVRCEHAVFNPEAS